MGGVRWCKNCHTSHEGPIGNKCQQFEGIEVQTSMDNQASTGQASGSTVTSEQARLVAEHVTVVKDSSTVTSTGTSNSQDLILAELQKMSQRFSKLEEQTSQDRSVLSELMNQVHSNNQTTVSKNIIATSTGSSTLQAGTSVMTDVYGQVNNNKDNSSGQSFSGNIQFVNSVNSTSLVSSGVNIPSLVQHMGARPKTSNTAVPNGLTHLPVHSTKSGGHGMGHHLTNVLTTSDNLQRLNDMESVNRQQNTVLIPDNISVMYTGHNNGTYGTAGQVYHQVGGTYMNNVHVPQNVPILSSTVATAGGVQAEGVSVGSMLQKRTESDTTHKVHLQNATESIIPSLQQLRQANDIHTKVQRKYQELEDTAGHGNQGNLDLLLEVLSKKQKQDKIKVQWPQDLAFVGSMRKRPTYEQLTICQWLIGFMRIRQEEQDPVIKENMSDYVTELLQDACDYGWDSAKGAHSVLLHRMQDGVVTWHNVKEIHKIRKRYAHTVVNSSVSDKKVLKIVPCLKYNKGQCSRSSDHEWQNMLLKHMCTHCHNVLNKTEGHPRKDCWKAPKDQSKNN